MKRARLSALGAIALPLVLFCGYQFLNHAHQRGDEAYHLALAQDAYLTLTQEGISAGLSKIFFERFFRPILSPYFVLPFAFMTAGRMDLAAVLFMTVNFSGFLFFLYRALRQSLSPVESAVSVALIAITPTFFKSMIFLTAEGCFLTAVAALLWVVHDSRFLKSRTRDSLAALSLGLAIAIRPIEGLVTGAIIGYPVLTRALKSGLVQSRDLIVLGFVWLAGVASICLFAFAHPSKSYQFIGFFFAAIPLLPMAFRNSLKLSKSFLAFGAISFCIPMLWFGPIAPALYWWVEQCNFSDWSRRTGGLNGASTMGLFASALEFQCWPALVSLLGLGFINADFRNEKWRTFAVYLAGFILFVAGASLTTNGEARYYSGVGLLLYIQILTIVFSGSWAKRTAVILIAATLLVYDGSILSGKLDTVWRMRAWVSGPWIFPPTSVDDVDRALDSIVEKIPPRNPTKAEALVCVIPMPTENTFDLPGLDPWTLTILSRERGAHVRFEGLALINQDSLAERFNNFVANYCDFYLVEPTEYQPHPRPFLSRIDVPMIHWQDGFMHDVGDLLVSKQRNNQLSEIQAAFLISGTYWGRMGSRAQYALFQNLRKVALSHGEAPIGK